MKYTKPVSSLLTYGSARNLNDWSVYLELHRHLVQFSNTAKCNSQRLIGRIDITLNLVELV